MDRTRKRLVILGSTGSIGVQALEVARLLGLPITALSANRQVDRIEEQAREFHPRAVAMADEAAARELRLRLADTDIAVLSGQEGVCEIAARQDADMVLTAVVGMAGLLPTLTAIEAGHDIALANKETLVAGGALVTEAAKRRGVRLLPVDSEHSAIFQCLQGAPPHEGAERLILTASGGPFFGKTKQELEQVTVEQALRHPNWSMGAKITIDSATMMNKGLELIEASWLFSMPPDRIDVVVHRESVVHSLVAYRDHSVIAQMGVPDMRIPIQYALTYPERLPSAVPALDLAAFGRLTFFAPDEETFPAIALCRRAMAAGGTCPAALNGANERAVALFLDKRIAFTDITRLVAAVAEREWPVCRSIDDVLAADAKARRLVEAECEKMR